MAVIRGTNGNDTLNGTANADTISGLAGDDRLSGLGGNDMLLGGRGNDRIDGGAGSDTLSVRDAPHNWFIRLDEGTAVAFEFESDEDFDSDTLTGVENVDGSAQTDEIFGDGRANTFSGNGGSDRLIGNGGNDTLRGGDDGDDLFGGAGNDLVDGGAGVDRYFASENGALDLDLAAGRASQGGEVDRLMSVEDAFGGIDGDAMRGTGGANLLVGVDGNDRLDGRGGGDELWGERGDDTLFGGSGDDFLWGAGGDDRLTGGAGDDLFTYRFYASGSDTDDQGQDVITDFARGSDQLNVLAAGLGRDVFDAFDTNRNGRVDDADGRSEAGEVGVDSSVRGGSTVLSFEDLGGPGAGNTLRITVEGGTDLRESDFTLI